MITKNEIRDFYGRIIGWIEIDSATGNKTARDFYGRVLGKYDKNRDVTTDFYGRVLMKGDGLSGLIWEADSSHKQK